MIGVWIRCHEEGWGPRILLAYGAEIEEWAGALDRTEATVSIITPSGSRIALNGRGLAPAQARQIIEQIWAGIRADGSPIDIWIPAPAPHAP